jgi:hypothetical protein
MTVISITPSILKVLLISTSDCLITLFITSIRAHAELMEQIINAHEVPIKIIDLGVKSYFRSSARRQKEKKSIL